MQEENKPN